MRHDATALACLAMASLSGCYLAHERACTDGPPATTDTGLVAIEDEAVAPGARPSDAAGARTWVEPPVGTDEPSCDVGDVVSLGDEPRRVSAPVLAWNGTTFGAVWSVEGEPGEVFCPHAIYQQLLVDGQPAAPERVLTGLREPAAIAWAEDRYLLAAGAGGPANYLAILDRTGTISGLSMPAELVTAVARFPAARAWVTASHTYALDEWSPARLTVLDDQLGETRVIELEPVSSASALRLAVVGSRVVVQGDRRRGAELDVLEGAGLVPAGRVTAGDSGPWLVPSRDGATTGGIAGGAVRSLSSDPFAMSERGVRSVAGPGGGRALARDGAMAADDHGGTSAICWIESPRASDAGTPNVLRFQLMDAEGVAIGPAIDVDVALGAPGPSSCALSSNGADQYLMAFTADGARGPRMFAVPMRVRR